MLAESKQITGVYRLERPRPGGHWRRLESTIAAALTGVLLTYLAPALAQPSPVKFENYPRYGKTPPPDHREKLQPIVDGVLGSIRAGGKASVRVVGHADFDANGREFETKVSQERATVAQQTLVAMISAQASMQGVSQDRLWQNLTMTVDGLGTKQAVPNPRSEEDRKKNRRVEIFWAVHQVPPPPPPRPTPRPTPEPPPLVYQLVGAGIWNGPAKVTVVGDQLVRFKITNSNPVLGTTIAIEQDPSGPKQTRQIPPMGTVEIEFSMLTHKNKPIQWHFDVSTQSDAFVVTWSAMSFAPAK